MEYQLEIVIDLPRERVVELFDSAEYLFDWQPGLKDYQLLSGEEGQPGARTRLTYDTNNRQVEMVETIVRRDLPDEFSATYQAAGVNNWITNRFVEEGPDRTRWVQDNRFKLRGLTALMAVFLPGAFRKQTQEDMNRFKAFAESA